MLWSALIFYVCMCILIYFGVCVGASVECDVWHLLVSASLFRTERGTRECTRTQM